MNLDGSLPRGLKAAPLMDQAAVLDVTFVTTHGMKKKDDDLRQERGKARALLMEQVQQGSTDAFRALLDDIGPSITQFLRRRVVDPAELEDIYQEVFFSLFEARHTYQPGRALEPWLFAIARNVAADYARRYWSRAQREDLMADPPDQPDPGPPADLPPLEDVIARLPQAQREAFSMLKLEGMSLEAAAARSGISVSALKVRAHRAYKTLKKLIGGE